MALRRNLTVSLCLVLLCGCGYNKGAKAFMDPYRRGELSKAALAAQKASKKHKSDADRLIYCMEEGLICRDAGDLKASNEAFACADGFIDQFDEQAKVKLSNEAAAAITNQTVLPYEGYAYDRIMVNTYKALNHMELGEIDAAKVELIRAYHRQQDAVAKYAKQIEDRQKLRADKKKDYDCEKAENDPRFKQSYEKDFGDLASFSAYGDYVNPFAEYVQGIFFLSCPADASDRERAVVSLKRVCGMVPESAHARGDLEMASALANGGAVPATTYVLFESGLAPRRETVRIDLPLFLVNNKVDYIGVAFPRLVTTDGACPGLNVQTSRGLAKGELLCDMDKVIKQEFKNQFPAILTRTMISTAVKAAAAYAANEATRRSNTWVNLVTRISTTVYQAAMNQADLRTWQSLPKQFHVSRLATPPDRQLTLVLADGNSVPVKIADGTVNVIYVRSIQSGVPPVVRQFKLK